MASLSSHKSSPAVPENTLSLTYFKKVNPILLANGNIGLAPEKNPTTTTKPVDPPTAMATPPSTRPLIRKIQTNPYINDSVDEKWTDPQTRLVYHTDLCQYLGHSRTEVGRHTLTGVGQYMKTVFNIKVRWCWSSTSAWSRPRGFLTMSFSSNFLGIWRSLLRFQTRLASRSHYGKLRRQDDRGTTSGFQLLRDAAFHDPFCQQLGGIFRSHALS